MKNFIDTEFIESFHKPIYGKRRHFIDLISIGIVAEDGQKYYAISSEYKEKDANPWVKENVLLSIRKEAFDYPAGLNAFSAAYIKPIKIIAEEIQKFIYRQVFTDYISLIGDQRKTVSAAGFSDYEPTQEQLNWIFGKMPDSQPQFYGYYADYDWVLFCSLFGRMIDLPKGFPMYCRDLKQMTDEWVEKHITNTGLSFKEGLQQLKDHPDYPKQTNEHNALDDATWNSKLYKFLTI